MEVPLLDVALHHAPIQKEIEDAALRVLRSGRYILGPEIQGFEKELAESLGSADAIAVSSGTDALLAAFMALGAGPGSEVVMPPFTFFATAGVLSRLGAKPVFVDVEPDSFNMDATKVEDAMTPRTIAMEPVHLFGQCADLDVLSEISKRRGVPIVEDACQAIGAKWNGRQAGTVGAAGCFSFFPSKNLGGAGDAGAIATNDPKLAERLRAIRVHGGARTYFHDEVGGNFRMDAIQAAILRVKLIHLSGWEERRRKNAEIYRRLFEEAGLAGDPVVLPAVKPGARHVYNQFVIRVPRRDDLAKHLGAARIGHAVYYPLPLHLQPCFGYLGYSEGSFPESERACREVLALPIFPELVLPQLEQVVGSIREFYRGKGA